MKDIFEDGNCQEPRPSTPEACFEDGILVNNLRLLFFVLTVVNPGTVRTKNCLQDLDDKQNGRSFTFPRKKDCSRKPIV